MRSRTYWTVPIAAASIALAACQPLPKPFQTSAAAADRNPLLVPGPDLGSLSNPDKAPAAGIGAIRVAIEHVSGAPGDGGTALVNALRQAMIRQGIAPAEAGAVGGYMIVGAVRVSAAERDQDQVEIDWSLLAPDRAKLATISQRNLVPKGRLDGPWGEIAAFAAEGGASGLALALRRLGPAAPPAR